MGQRWTKRCAWSSNGKGSPHCYACIHTPRMLWFDASLVDSQLLLCSLFSVLPFLSFFSSSFPPSFPLSFFSRYLDIFACVWVSVSLDISLSNYLFVRVSRRTTDKCCCQRQRGRWHRRGNVWVYLFGPRGRVSWRYHCARGGLGERVAQEEQVYTI